MKKLTLALALLLLVVAVFHADLTGKNRAACTGVPLTEGGRATIPRFDVTVRLVERLPDANDIRRWRVVVEPDCTCLTDWLAKLNGLKTGEEFIVGESSLVGLAN